jgi:hypothetical protein
MLAEKEIENLLSNSTVAQEFFRRAQLGLFSDKLYNDLYLNIALKQIFSLSHDRLPRYDTHEKLILRIHDDGPVPNMWRGLDYQTFVLLCVQEFMHAQQLERRASLRSLVVEHHGQRQDERIGHALRLHI